MENIYIKDRRNGTYYHMANLREGVIHLIHSNVEKMQRADMQITICSADSRDDGKLAELYNYKEEVDLYDKLIIEYNLNHPKSILNRWTRD